VQLCTFPTEANMDPVLYIPMKKSFKNTHWLNSSIDQNWVEDNFSRTKNLIKIKQKLNLKYHHSVGIKDIFNS
jgi:hypothetical protein